MESATTPSDRRTLLVRRIVADSGFEIDAAGTTVEYDERTIRLEVDDEQRQRLEALLAEYAVFKIQQPETRKAPGGVVYLSAVTDPKYAADFLDSLFRSVYGADEGYELGVRSLEE